MKFSIVSTKFFTLLTMVLLSICLSGNASAQSGTTGIRGTVADQNGAAVAGATVRLLNPGTGFNRSGTTSEDGKFNFPGIPPATYRLEVEAAGFKKSSTTDVQALVDKQTTIPVKLEIGDVSALVEVSADGIESIVNTQDASLGNNFAGGRPQDALAFSQSGRDAQAWLRLPKAMARGDVSALKDWSPGQAVDALHKLCHDLLAVKTGAPPRFFDATDLPVGGSVAALTAWAKALTAATRTVEHPFNAGLMLEALVSQAESALNSGQ